MKLHIKRNDIVKVITGDDLGKTGKVLKVFRQEYRAIVEGVNFVKRHLRKGHPQAQQGGIIQKEAPVHISNLMLVCMKCNELTRIVKKELADGNRVRACKNCGEILDKV